MNLLAIDSASAGCAVAILADGRLTAISRSMARGQDAALVPLIKQAMAEARLDFPSLDRIAVLRGPGSFTGLRIGLAAARGLGLALGRPVLGLDRLWLHRAALPALADLLVVLDSRRSEAFCQYFSGPRALPPHTAAPAVLLDYDKPGLRVTGDAAAAMHWQHAQPAALPEPEVVCAVRLAATLDPAAHPALPLYLRAPDVSHGPAPPVEEAPW